MIQKILFFALIGFGSISFAQNMPEFEYEQVQYSDGLPVAQVCYYYENTSRELTPDYPLEFGVTSVFVRRGQRPEVNVQINHPLNTRGFSRSLAVACRYALDYIYNKIEKAETGEEFKSLEGALWYAEESKDELGLRNLHIAMDFIVHLRAFTDYGISTRSNLQPKLYLTMAMPASEPNNMFQPIPESSLFLTAKEAGLTYTLSLMQDFHGGPQIFKDIKINKPIFGEQVVAGLPPARISNSNELESP